MLSALSARFINILVPGVNICIAPAAFDCTTSHNIIDVCTHKLVLFLDLCGCASNVCDSIAWKTIL